MSILYYANNPEASWNEGYNCVKVEEDSNMKNNLRCLAQGNHHVFISIIIYFKHFRLC